MVVPSGAVVQFLIFLERFHEHLDTSSFQSALLLIVTEHRGMGEQLRRENIEMRLRLILLVYQRMSLIEEAVP